MNKESLLTKDFQVSFAFTKNERSRKTLPPLLVLIASSLTFFYQLTGNKEGDSFYSAGIWAGTKSWRAMLVGAVDPEMSVTTDKPSLPMWPSIILSRIFGYHEWTVMAPYAAISVGSALLLYFIVRRVVGETGGMAAVALWLCTPAPVLMARYNKPEPFLLFFILLALLLSLRMFDEPFRLKKPLVIGVVLGLAYLCKLQVAGLLVPALLLSLVCFTQWSMAEKVKSMALAALGGISVILAWGVLAQIAIAGQNTWVDGTTNGSLWRMLFLQNASQSAEGFTPQRTQEFARLFGAIPATMGGLLLPLALVGSLAVMGLCVTRRRADTMERPIILLGLTLWIIVLAFTLTPGVFHEYYVYLYTSLTAALTVLFLFWLWPMRRGPVIIFTAVLFELAWILWRSNWAPETSALFTFALLTGYPLILKGSQKSMVIFSTLMLSVPSFFMMIQTYDHIYRGWAVGNGVKQVSAVHGNIKGLDKQTVEEDLTKSKSYAGASVVPEDLVKYLQEGGSDYRWALATIDSAHSTAYQVALKQPTLSIGAYWGRAPNFTLTEFQEVVRAGEVRYFIFSDYPIVTRLEGTEADRIQDWVMDNYTATWVGRTAVYDLAASDGQ